ncbi:hypothetical protein [Ancylobacter sp. G4_0304]|uniref:hypothetical protein n=1 Tax=Ancylobacter sp. G4_0304 TaxID=3114289 RepID=UPI0039C66F42
MAAVIAVVIGAGALALRGGGTSRTPAQTSVSSAPPVAHSPPPIAQAVPLPPSPTLVSEQRTRINVPTTWTEIPIAPDASRPNVALVASEPIRVRSKGQLYLVAGEAPVSIDLKGATSIDVRAISAPVSLTVVRSANVEGN